MTYVVSFPGKGGGGNAIHLHNWKGEEIPCPFRSSHGVLHKTCH